MGLILGVGRSPGVGHGNPLQYSCLGHSMDRGTWWATAHEVAELDVTEHTHGCSDCIQKKNQFPWCFLERPAQGQRSTAQNVEQLRGTPRWGGGQEVKEIDDDSRCGLRDSF